MIVDSEPPTPPSEGWSLVLPVKRRTAAKTRLAASLGLDRAEAGELAIAFALDTLTAALSTTTVRSVVVVTDDDDAAAQMGAMGVVIVAETEPVISAPGYARLNAAIMLGANTCHGPTFVLTADLPALRPAELEAALAMAATYPRSLVTDTPGTGTTMLAAGRPDHLRPAFGANSAQVHRESGAVPITAALPTLRRDIDTAADLAAVLRLGTGPHTARLVASAP